MHRYSKSVLLIDDNSDDLLLFSRELKKLGFDVLATGSPEQAMSAIVGGSIGCLITDQAMPISGQELVNIAQSVRSDIGVIFLSGAPLTGPVPSGTTFVDKEDREKLKKVVLNSMARWRREDV
jgi:CheY-like chemotaxis protein